MNVNDLTVGQLKEIMATLNLTAPQQKDEQHPFVGKYVIARCYEAGVHAGEVVRVKDEEVILKNSRRLWSWKAREGVALSGVAQFGLTQPCKVDVMNPEISLIGVCELIVCSETSRKSIESFK
jgi:hypothetical protein